MIRIVILTTPKSVQAYQFVKDVFTNLKVNAVKKKNAFFVSHNEIVTAIREQKEYAQKMVADFLERGSKSDFVIAFDECKKI